MAKGYALWPENPRASGIADPIDWSKAHPDALRSTRVWDRIPPAEAKKLKTDPSLSMIYNALPPEVQAQIVIAAAGSRRTTPADKDDILGLVDEARADAEIGGDMLARLRAIELMAKLQQLLGQKEQPDPNITINVITGVDRGPKV